MDPFDPQSTVGQHEFGGLGFQGSVVGWGTGSSRMSDLELLTPHVAAESGALAGTLLPDPAAASVNSEAGSLAAAIGLGMNVFELGCIADQPVATLRRLADLIATLEKQPEPKVSLVIFRFSFRRMPKSPVDLEYRFQAQTVDEVFRWASLQLEPWFEQLQEILQSQKSGDSAMALKKLRLAWVWDDVDYRQNISSGMRKQIQQLVARLRSLCPESICWQGVGGFRWQSLAELISQEPLAMVLLHGYGILGPDVVGRLSPICQRNGVALVTSLPCYGGLLSHPMSLAGEHPASKSERLAAETARVVAEEHGLTLPELAWSFLNQNDSVDCSLIELPTAEAARHIWARLHSKVSARIEALVTRHLRHVEREHWFG